MSYIMVLNDGETFTTLDGCTLMWLSDEIDNVDDAELAIANEEAIIFHCFTDADGEAVENGLQLAAVRDETMAMNFTRNKQELIKRLADYTDDERLIVTIWSEADIPEGWAEIVANYGTRPHDMMIEAQAQVFRDYFDVADDEFAGAVA